jgi:CO dehydrogenase nickel-insertion accessory protein CooC1
MLLGLCHSKGIPGLLVVALSWLSSRRSFLPKIAIMGLGGVGKTQLVLELLFRTKEKHQNCAVIWIPATNTESLHPAYLDVAQRLGIQGWNEQNADVKALMQKYLDIAGQWLLVFS